MCGYQYLGFRVLPCSIYVVAKLAFLFVCLFVCFLDLPFFFLLLLLLAVTLCLAACSDVEILAGDKSFVALSFYHHLPSSSLWACFEANFRSEGSFSCNFSLCSVSFSFSWHRFVLGDSETSCGWVGGWVCAFLAGGVGGGGGSGGGLRTRHMHLFPKHVVRLGNLGNFFTLMCFFSSCGGYESRSTPLVHLE